MKARLLEHLLSIVFVTLALLVTMTAIGLSRREARERAADRYGALGDVSFINTEDPFQRALLSDAADIYFPGQANRNDTLVDKILDYQRKQLADKLQRAHLTEGLSPSKIGELLAMFVKFLIVYAVVMLLTYYGVQTIAVWRFCRRKQRATQHSRSLVQRAGGLARAFFLGVASFVLFSPAYVIAYSIRTELNTDTVFFMALLGVVSNGLLMVYANKFYAFLLTESRKGYVETAIVKNLRTSYELGHPNGIPYGAVLSPIKKFKGHVFDHIFTNARHQYLSTIKEQASFLVTGLIIIEMALNIHGHLSYEMLRQMLYRNYDIVIAIVLCMFYTVKATELFADGLVWRAAAKLENKA